MSQQSQDNNQLLEEDLFLDLLSPGRFLAVGILILVGWIISQNHFLLFHTFSEMFSIIVGCVIFVVTWHAKDEIKGGYFLFIGIAYLFIAILDSFHTLGYKGLEVFYSNNPTNTGAQLWIASRYMESISLLIALFLKDRVLRFKLLTVIYTAITSLILLSIIVWEIFPVCYTTELTTFKKASEYIISGIICVSIFMLFRERNRFDSHVFKLLVAASILTILSEISFTLYIDAYGIPNVIGHILKILSFYLVYKAIVDTGLSKPYRVMFRELKQSETELRMNHDLLNEQVLTRTRELTAANKELNETLAKQMETEKNLRTQVMRNQTILKTTVDGFCLIDRKGRICDVNDAFCRILQKKPEEILLKELNKIIQWDITNPDKMFDFLFEQNHRKFISKINIAQKEIHIEVSSNVFYADYEIFCFTFIKDITEKVFAEKLLNDYKNHLEDLIKERTAELNKVNQRLQEDITRRTLVEQRLRKSEERFRRFVEQAGDAIFVFTQEGKIIESNEKAFQLLGYSKSELIGRDIREINQTLELPELTRTKKSSDKQGSIIRNCSYRQKNGSQISVEESISIFEIDETMRLLTLVRDVTARKRAEEAERKLEKHAQLAHAGRLTALGEMAAGIAHEIHQPLTVVRLAADDLKLYFERKDPEAIEAEAIDDVLRQVKRATKIIKNMKAFSHGNSTGAQIISLQEPLEAALTFFKEQFRVQGIELEVDIEPGLPQVKIDSQKFEQVIVNFITNARYAVHQMEAEQSNGYRKRVLIRAKKDAQNQLVIIEVEDNGIGMSPELIERCTDPFFTTKKVGEGTGLGLSIAQSIVKEFNTKLEIESGPDQGSLFRLLVPIYHESEQDQIDLRQLV